MARMSPVEFRDAEVLPVLFERLPAVFPEFDWRPRGSGEWVAGPHADPAVAEFVGAGRVVRLACKRSNAGHFFAHGGRRCSWERYLTGGASEPQGKEFVRAVVRLAELVGVDASPLVRDPVSDEEKARWAKRAEERKDEAARRAAEAERRERRERDALAERGKRFVADAASRFVEDNKDIGPIAAYLTRRGRDVRKMPGGAWPTGAIYATTLVGGRRDGEGGGRRVGTIVVPVMRAGSITGAQRIFVDRLGEPRPVKVYRDGEEVRKAAVGLLDGGYAQVGRGFPDRVLVVCEGWETGVAIHQATGWTVRPLISTSGLVRIELSEADLAQIDRVVVAGDLDREYPGRNGRPPFRPGQQAAQACADRVRTVCKRPAAVALPAHAWAPGLVTADELPADGKSVDWEDIANKLGDEVVKARLGLSAAAATPEVQGECAWIAAWKAEHEGGGGGEGPAKPREDRSRPRVRPDGRVERWHHEAQRWVAWDEDQMLWLEPFGPLLPANHLDAAREYLLARHAPARVDRRGGGLALIATAGRAYRHIGTRWTEYSEDPAQVIRGDVRRYFAGHCKPKVTRGKYPLTHYVLANISKTEVETIAAAAIDEVRTLTPLDDFQSQFWVRPNVAAEGDRLVFLADVAAWDRRIDRPEEEGLPEPDQVIPLRNGLFNLQGWRERQRIEMLPHTPLFFNTGSVEAELPIREAMEALGDGGSEGLRRLEAFGRGLCPEWCEFLDRTFRHEDPAAAPTTAREVHKVIGNLLTTDMTYHQANMVWLVGPPGGGKSVFQGVIMALLGASNCVPSTIAQLDSQFHLRSWIGKRLAVFPDMDVSGRADKKKIVEMLKMLATGDPISVDRKHLDEIVGWRNMARMLIAANQMPPLPDPSSSFDRRSMCFEFRHPVPAEEKDPNLMDRLTTPRSLAGVLILGLIGQIDLAEEGFIQPVWSAGPLDDLRDQGSMYPAFIAECLEIVRPTDEGYEDAWLASREIGAAFARYAEVEGSNYTPRVATLISEIKAPLVQAGWLSVKPTRHGNAKGYQGLRLSARGRELVQAGEQPETGMYSSVGYV